MSRQRFSLEAEVTGGLEHPGIVPVYGLGSYGDGRPYYVMRFIRGDSLKEAIANYHKQGQGQGLRDLELRKLLRRFLDVCNAIDYAHGRGVLHRDIKPANVVLGNHGETLVVDWGLAKALGKSGSRSSQRAIVPRSSGNSSETVPGHALGTPAYMSPEQAEGEIDRLGPRSDVYSLGATLACLLTGAPPFSGDALEVIRCVRRGEFTRPRAVDPSIDRALEAICLKAMALRAEDRYESCRSLAEDVERWMAGEPVTAWREPFGDRVRRWARRNRTAVTAAAVALVVALAGTGAVLAVQTHANVELKAANTELAIANTMVKRSNADLQAANARERERFELAMQAVNLFHGDVSEDLLLKQKQFESLRSKLLRGAANFYGKLEELLEGQRDPASRTALGKAYFELGTLNAKLGRQSDALAVQRKSVSVRRELAESPGVGPQALVQLAESLLSTGALRSEIGDAGGIENCEEAQGLAERAARLADNNDATRLFLGRAYYVAAIVYHTLAKPDKALESCMKARTVQQALADERPKVPLYQMRLAATESDLGVGFKLTGHPHESLQAYDRARAILERLIAAGSSSMDYRMELGRCYHNLGVVLSQTGKRAEGLKALEKSLELRRAVVEEAPGVSRFQRDVAATEGDIGVELAAIGRPSQAASAFERSLAVLERLAAASPADSAVQSDMAVTLIDIGSSRQTASQPAEAARAFRRAVAILERLPTLRVEDYYNVACVRSRLAGLGAVPGSNISSAEARAEADRAMSWLKLAVERGYRNLALMRRDTDLAPLRSRTDFKVLLMDASMPADAFER